MLLPTDIQEIFFDTLLGNKSALEFEQWLYADKRLEGFIDSNDYLDLISFGFKVKNAEKGLSRLLEKHIDKGELEKRRILNLLAKALNRDKELPEILMTFYDLYCKGYYFMDTLGFDYGLPVEGLYSQSDCLNDLALKQQKKLLESFYPAMETEIQKVISWIDNGEIVLTGIKDEYEHFEYTDNRTNEEKPTNSISDQYWEDSTTQKPWWKFW